MSESKSDRILNAAGNLVGSILGATAAAGTACIAWSALAVNHRMHLPDAIGAAKRTFHSGATGQVSYYVDDGGAGRPLLLIHSVNAAASACEMQPLFDRFRGERPVYAPDLPGFGMSDRSERDYSPDLYATFLIEFVEQQIAPQRGPVDVIALSLSCEFGAIAVPRRPDLFQSFIFHLSHRFQMIAPMKDRAPAGLFAPCHFRFGARRFSML